MIEKLLVLNNFSTNCYENLAIEEQLLRTVDEKSVILYLWQNENTIVIGKNQNPLAECDINKIKEDGVYVARRLSGGGAVFHDKGNLNFTFITSKENYNQQMQLEVIKKACALAGIKAEVSGRNDILVDSKKFSGNAFYHTKNAAYHHGTLLIDSDINKIQNYLTPDISKLQAKGVKSVKARVINLKEIKKDLTTDKMRGYLQLAAEEVYQLKAAPFNELDKEQIKELTKFYSSKSYVFETPIPFTAIFKGRLSLGSFELRFLIRREKIVDLQVFTDALDDKISEKLKNSLLGVTYNILDMEKALKDDFQTDFVKEIINMVKKSAK
ncbi:MAG: lipoate--protein ligase [Clostridia bacterium]|nr:lipoate--protein ligase [Clostridia bacterium]